MDYKEKYEHGLECIQEILSGAGDSIKTSILRKRLQPFFPELKESEDERIRKELVEWLKSKLANPSIGFNPAKMEKWVAYLEKVKNFDEQLEQVYKTADEVQYKRGYGKGYVDGMVAAKKKELERQAAIKDGNSIDPQFAKPITNTETKYPKFKIGDWVVNEQGSAFLIAYIDEENQRYVFEIGGYTKEQMNYENIEFADTHYHLWSISDAKDGDMIICEGCEYLLFKSFSSTDNRIKLYGWYNEQTNNFHFGADVKLNQKANILPASREQRGLFFDKMNEEGYTWNAEEKELSQISVTKKSDEVWSEEDEIIFTDLIDIVGYCYSDEEAREYKDKLIAWLKSVKQRMTWKPTGEQINALEWQVNNTAKNSWQYRHSKELLEQLQMLA